MDITERHVQAVWYDAALRPKRLATRRNRAVAFRYLYEHGVAHLPGHAVLVGRHAAKDERSDFDGDRRVAVRALERGTERKRALPVRLEPVYEASLAERSEGGAGMADSVRGKCDARKRVV